ncbi:MAG: hypothetical protein MZU91_07700 [Desulfosudis oleivorans]|nr:hypothetical protein [Desulfosudis oleivorans]
MGGGLQADRRRRVARPLFDLPVRQPARRDGWHREDFLDRRGHRDQPRRARGRRGVSAGRRRRPGGAPAAARGGLDPGPPGLDADEVRLRGWQSRRRGRRWRVAPADGAAGR